MTKAGRSNGQGRGAPEVPCPEPISFPEGAGVFGYTHGCRLNACETDAMVESAVRRFRGSVSRDPSTADIIIVNTCTVTGRSRARSRKTVKSFRTRNPGALIVVAGCASEISPEDYAGIENCLVMGNPGKSTFPLIPGETPEPGRNRMFPESVGPGPGKTRSFLKIQDGCDHRCAYCIVPLARGPSRSRRIEDVMDGAERLKSIGAGEICLVGVDLADYGRDLGSGDYRLPDLVRDLLKIGGFRVRLSSLEPNSLPIPFLERLCLPGLCRHFHIPLQSGSDRVLQAMGRRYDRGWEEELLGRIHTLFPGACVGSDIITGFPGESGEDFEETLSLVRSGLLTYLHVFPYSMRPGTAAAELKGLHPELVRERADRLREESERLRREFRESMIGTEGLILVESRTFDNRRVGLTDNYIPVKAPREAEEGELTRVVLRRGNICWKLR